MSWDTLTLQIHNDDLKWGLKLWNIRSSYFRLQLMWVFQILWCCVWTIKVQEYTNKSYIFTKSQLEYNTL